MIRAPPSLAGAVNVTVTLCRPAVAAVIVGAPGTVGAEPAGAAPRVTAATATPHTQAFQRNGHRRDVEADALMDHPPCRRPNGSLVMPQRPTRTGEVQGRG